MAIKPLGANIMNVNLNNSIPVDLPKVIFAANKFQANYVTSFLQASNIGFACALGFYDGIEENSWIINQEDLRRIGHLLIDEKSVLELYRPEITRNYFAKLVWLYGDDAIDLGELVEVSEKEARANIGWTSRFMPNFGTEPRQAYFICKAL
jgi:hypothetical protein